MISCTGTSPGNEGMDALSFIRKGIFYSVLLDCGQTHTYDLSSTLRILMLYIFELISFCIFSS